VVDDGGVLPGVDSRGGLGVFAGAYEVFWFEVVFALLYPWAEVVDPLAGGLGVEFAGAVVACANPFWPPCFPCGGGFVPGVPAGAGGPHDFAVECVGEVFGDVLFGEWDGENAVRFGVEFHPAYRVSALMMSSQVGQVKMPATTAMKRLRWSHHS